MRYVNVTDARKELLGVVEKKEAIIVTRKGTPAVVVIPFEDYQQMAALRDAARDPQRFMESVKAHRTVQRGTRLAEGEAARHEILATLDDLKAAFTEQAAELRREVRKVESKVDRLRATSKSA